MIPQEEINSTWTLRSDNYNKYVVEELQTDRPAKWIRLIEKNAPALRPLRVLDAGCGPGFFSAILSDAGHLVTGIDGSDRMLEHARTNATLYGRDPELIKGDFGRLPFADDTFDLLVCRNVTHIIQEHLKVYGEWNRVLKPGGVLLIFDANWHLPLSSEAWFKETMERERKCIEVYGSDYSGNTSFDEDRSRKFYESERHRLGDLQRPDWDCGILQAMGYQEISYDRDITGPLWDEKEKLIYGHTPMFVIRAVKSLKS